jgi:hypothetical protein
VSDAPVPAPVPAKSGGALKIILIVLGILAAIVILVVGLMAYGCYHLAQSMKHAAADGKTVSMLGTTVTTADSASFTAADLGTDIYPGASPSHGGSKLDMSAASVVTGVYLTSDPVSKVEAFYKDKFGGGVSDFNFGGTAMITHKVSDKETVTVTVTGDNSNDGKTRITIQHTKSKS